MQSFSDWVNQVWANVFTLVSVALSGLISWIVSAVYYRKTNRTSLKTFVIKPTLELLEKNCSYNEKYKMLCAIFNEYSIRYMNEAETKNWRNLVEAYEKVQSYDYYFVCAESLFSYFEFKLKDSGIEAQCVPVEYEGEIVYYDYPFIEQTFLKDLSTRLEQYDFEYQEDLCKQEIDICFCSYLKSYFSTKTIKFFDDYSINEVLEKSKIAKQWEKKFNELKQAKQSFLDLPISKKTKKEIDR